MLAVLLLGGCWDYVDLERRALILGVGVDAVPDEPDRFILSVEIPVPGGVQGGEDGGGSGDDEPKFVVEADGRSLITAGNMLRSRLQRNPLWNQVISVVVSEEVAREGIAPVVDVILRHNELNLRAHLYVVEGSAKAVLQYEPNIQPLSSRYLRSLAEQYPLYPSFPLPEAIVLVNRDLRAQRVALVPKLTMEGDQPYMKGAAVLSEGRLVGWLDGREAEGANWFRGLVKESLVETVCPGHPDGVVVAWAKAGSHRLQASMKGGLPHFETEVSLTARLVDMSRCPLVPEDTGDLHKIEQALVQEVKQTIESAVRRARNELQVDFLGLGMQWRRSFPEAGGDKHDWPQLFLQSSIDVDVRMSSIGVSYAGRLRHSVPYR